MVEIFSFFRLEESTLIHSYLSKLWKIRFALGDLIMAAKIMEVRKYGDFLQNP